jgi:oleate hydratase
MKNNAGVKGAFTTEDLAEINPLKPHELTTHVLDFLNSVPPYYIRYSGRDKSVALKESVLHPKFPKDTDAHPRPARDR